MGEWTDADTTTIVMPIGALFSGLIMVGGGIAAITYGTQANDAAEHSGNSTLAPGNAAFASGGAAILAGASAITAAITSICMKVRDVRVRKDPTDQAAPLKETEEALETINAGLKKDAATLGKVVIQ